MICYWHCRLIWNRSLKEKRCYIVTKSYLSTLWWVDFKNSISYWKKMIFIVALLWPFVLDLWLLTSRFWPVVIGSFLRKGTFGLTPMLILKSCSSPTKPKAMPGPSTVMWPDERHDCHWESGEKVSDQKFSSLSIRWISRKCLSILNILTR